MVERGDKLGLALEARQHGRISLEFGRQDLDGHLTPKLRIPGAVNYNGLSGKSGNLLGLN
jgi:hypothetical protein